MFHQISEIQLLLEMLEFNIQICTILILIHSQVLVANRTTVYPVLTIVHKVRNGTTRQTPEKNKNIHFHLFHNVCIIGIFCYVHAVFTLVSYSTNTQLGLFISKTTNTNNYS